MGSKTSSPQNSLSQYNERFYISEHPLYRSQSIKLLHQKLTSNIFILSILSACDLRTKQQYHRLINQKLALKAATLSPIQHYFQQSDSNVCSQFYKIYVVFAFKQMITLKQYVLAQKLSKKGFNYKKLDQGLNCLLLAISYLKYLNQCHSNINSTTILVDSQKFLLADPWICPSPYIQNYPSPQKLNKINSLAQDFDQYSNDIFAIGMTFLQVLSQSNIHLVYKKNNKIDMTQLKGIFIQVQRKNQNNLLNPFMQKLRVILFQGERQRLQMLQNMQNFHNISQQKTQRFQQKGIKKTLNRLRNISEMNRQSTKVVDKEKTNASQMFKKKPIIDTFLLNNTQQDPQSLIQNNQIQNIRLQQVYSKMPGNSIKLYNQTGQNDQMGQSRDSQATVKIKKQYQKSNFIKKNQLNRVSSAQSISVFVKNKHSLLNNDRILQSNKLYYQGVKSNAISSFQNKNQKQIQKQVPKVNFSFKNADAVEYNKNHLVLSDANLNKYMPNFSMNSKFQSYFPTSQHQYATFQRQKQMQQSKNSDLYYKNNDSYLNGYLSNQHYKPSQQFQQFQTFKTLQPYKPYFDQKRFLLSNSKQTQTYIANPPLINRQQHVQKMISTKSTNYKSNNQKNYNTHQYLSDFDKQGYLPRKQKQPQIYNFLKQQPNKYENAFSKKQFDINDPYISVNPSNVLRDKQLAKQNPVGKKQVWKRALKQSLNSSNVSVQGIQITQSIIQPFKLNSDEQFNYKPFSNRNLSKFSKKQNETIRFSETIPQQIQNSQQNTSKKIEYDQFSQEKINDYQGKYLNKRSTANLSQFQLQPKESFQIPEVERRVITLNSEKKQSNTRQEKDQNIIKLQFSRTKQISEFLKNGIDYGQSPQSIASMPSSESRHQRIESNLNYKLQSIQDQFREAMGLAVNNFNSNSKSYNEEFTSSNNQSSQKKIEQSINHSQVNQVCSEDLNGIFNQKYANNSNMQSIDSEDLTAIIKLKSNQQDDLVKEDDQISNCSQKKVKSQKDKISNEKNNQHQAKSQKNINISQYEQSLGKQKDYKFQLEKVQVHKHEQIDGAPQYQKQINQNTNKSYYLNQSQRLNEKIIDRQVQELYSTPSKMEYSSLPQIISRTIPEQQQEGSLNGSFQNQNTEPFGDYVQEQYQNGGKYYGYMQNAMRNGPGKFYYRDGGYYDGLWKNNMMNGYGKLYYDNGTLAYEGQWYKDQFHGRGKVYNDNAEQLLTQFDYQNFQNIQQYWEFYQGELSHDTKVGYGKIKLSNGQLFSGTFVNDKAHGLGRFSTLDGYIIKGIWHDGKLLKQISKQRKNQSQQNQIYQNQQFQRQKESMRIQEDYQSIGIQYDDQQIKVDDYLV